MSRLDMSLDQIAQQQDQQVAAAADNTEQTGDQTYGKSRTGNRGGRGRRNTNNRSPYTRGPRRNNNNNGNNNGNNAGNNAANNASNEQADNSTNMLKISPNSDSRSVAGAISHITRQGECPGMLAIGSASINQAIKAVAIARGYLEENKIELTCYPEFRSDKRAGLKLTLTKSSRRSNSTSNPEPEATPLKVSRESNPSSVAGAIANKLRDGERVSILAIGADCVTHAVKSIFIGRKYLEQDGLDISFRPEFTKVKFDDGRDCSAVKFVLLAQQI